MQSGTRLHIALLRRISSLSPSPNYHKGLSQFQKNQTRCRRLAEYQFNFSEDKQQSPLPFVNPKIYRSKNLTAPAKQNHKSKPKCFKDKSFTISGWSIDNFEAIQPQIQVRYDLNQKALAPAKINVQLGANKTYSLLENLKKKVPTYLDLQGQNQVIKNYNEKKYIKINRRNKYSAVNHININYDKENDAYRARGREGDFLSPIHKIPCYEAFIADIKLKYQIRKGPRDQQ